MRKGTKFLVTASVFAVAMNMNGCGAYGPPEEFDPRWNIAEPAYGVPYYYEDPMATVEPTEAGWYKLTQRTFAVLRIISVPQEVSEGEEPENAVYGVEMLSFYDGNEADLSNLSGISLRFEDRFLFSERDTLFVELGTALQENDGLLYQVKYDAIGPVYTRFVGDALELSDELKEHECYEYLYDFNAYIEWNYKVNRAGAEDTVAEPVYFEDGMTVENAAVFFDEIAEAK